MQMLALYTSYSTVTVIELSEAATKWNQTNWIELDRFELNSIHLNWIDLSGWDWLLPVLLTVAGAIAAATTVAIGFNIQFSVVVCLVSLNKLCSSRMVVDDDDDDNNNDNSKYVCNWTRKWNWNRRHRRKIDKICKPKQRKPKQHQDSN